MTYRNEVTADQVYDFVRAHPEGVTTDQIIDALYPSTVCQSDRLHIRNWINKVFHHGLKGKVEVLRKASHPGYCGGWYNVWGAVE